MGALGVSDKGVSYALLCFKDQTVLGPTDRLQAKQSLQDTSLRRHILKPDDLDADSGARHMVEHFTLIVKLEHCLPPES